MKNDLRVAVTKRMIKEALLRLLDTTPLDKIKISGLCEASGVNRATFYRHYDSLQAVLGEIESEFFHNMPRPVRQPKTVEEAREHVETVCTYFYDHADLIKPLFLNRTDADMMQGMQTFYRSFLELRRQDTSQTCPDEDTAKVIIALVSGGGHCLLRQWILGDIQKTPAQIAQILCNIFRWPNQIDTP